MRRSVNTAGVVGVIAALAVSMGMGVAHAAPVAYDPESETVGVGPIASSPDAAQPYALSHPDAAPSGANDFSCVPTAQHPEPVVLVHGTWNSAYGSFAGLSPVLKAQGYCVFAINYGEDSSSFAGGVLQRRGTGPVVKSAQELAAFVDGVRERTGVEKVDIVAHSQGGLVTRQYLRADGGADKVDKVVTLSGSNHGTTLDGIGTLGREVTDAGLDVLSVVALFGGQAAADQVVGSPLLAALDAGGDTEPGIDYTVVATTKDEVVTPYQSTFLVAGPGATVHNITLQDVCPSDTAGHSQIVYSPCAADIVTGALGS